MDKKKMLISSVILIGISVCIYLIQILLFHDVRDTTFYILQDFAFMPITIAIATIVVGELVNAQERKQRLEKTRMLTSSFFTQFGSVFLLELMPRTECEQCIKEIFLFGGRENEGTERDILKKASLAVEMDEAGYTAIHNILIQNRTTLLVIASNPFLLEHQCFTEMLWSIFHLLDEYRLRGAWSQLTKEDILHINHDFENTLRLMLESWIGNIHYLQETYPEFYSAASTKLINEGKEAFSMQEKV